MLTEGTSNKKKFQAMLSSATRNGVKQKDIDASLDWFKKVFKKPITKSDSPQNIIKRASNDVKTNRVLPGNLYIFEYHAITENLPYWDAMPLVIPFNEDKKHFWGINLHYAPPSWRAAIFDKLSVIVNDPIKSERQKQTLIWKEVYKLTQLKAVKPLIKCYLKSQVRSKFVYVEHDKWQLTLFLPLARFQGADDRTVHKQYLRDIK